MPLYQPLRHIVGHKPLIMAHLRVMRIVDRRDEIIPLACPLCRGRLQALKHIFDIRAVDLHKLRLHDIVGIICLVHRNTLPGDCHNINYRPEYLVYQSFFTVEVVRN